MFIRKLQISNFRNLASSDLEPHPALNIFYGNNGAGKTSILESLVVLSRGRSFRTSQASELIGPEGGSFRIYAETVTNENLTHRLGLERSGKRWKARRDGDDLTQLSQLTRSLPVVVMEPNSHLLVSGPPEARRKYLDWGMFHVERNFLNVWRAYSKSLKQRNAALRLRKAVLIDSLDEVLIRLGTQLDDFRRSHVKTIVKKTPILLDKLSAGLEKVEFDYDRGWSATGLEEALKAGRERDLERGMTSSGPHRADMELTFRDHAARSVMSRGEQKILSAALLLVQAEILAEAGKTPLIILDDLASEFDDEHFNTVLNRARRGYGQVWVSGARIPEIEGQYKLFHVERGAVQEML